MTTKCSLVVATLLIAIIATGSLVIWSKAGRGQPVAITRGQVTELPAEIYIGGAVNNPGFYPLRGDDRITSLIQAAGGASR